MTWIEWRVAEDKKRMQLTIEEAKREEVETWVNGVSRTGERSGERGRAGFIMLPNEPLYWLHKHE